MPSVIYKSGNIMGGEHASPNNNWEGPRWQAQEKK